MANRPEPPSPGFRWPGLGDRAGNGQGDKQKDGLAALFVRVAAATAMAAIVLLFGMIAAFALPPFLEAGSTGILGWSWSPARGEFGILPMLTGSILLAVSTLVLSFPFSLLLCGWIVSARPGPALAVVRAAIRLMAAIPTVVYGFTAVFLLTPLVRDWLGGSGLSWISATLVLTLLVLPTQVLILEAGLGPRLERLCPGGLALGFDRFGLLIFFVLPQAGKTLLASLLLGFGRAVGDTLLPLMLAGNAPRVPDGLGDGLRTLTAHMALVTANEVGGAAYNSLFAAGAMLLLINALVSLGLRGLQARQMAGMERPR